MNLLELWQEKYLAGQVRFDPELTIVHRPEPGGGWGTVYYSQARELYKNQVAGNAATSFDLGLMERVNIAEHGGLVIAANPNSLFEGHLVIYPRTKSPELALNDHIDIAQLAAEQTEFTFIHNADRSAASITDWAHFQTYHMPFALFDVRADVVEEHGGVRLSVIDDEYPAFVMSAESDSIERLAGFLFRIGELLRSNENLRGRRIPVNYIWNGRRAWIVPRSAGQSERAARYFGGLELGGTFCVPNSADLPAYDPKRLREEVANATLRTDEERETREWFEQRVKEILISQP